MRVLIEADRARSRKPETGPSSAGNEWSPEAWAPGKALIVEITHCIMDIMMLDIPLYGMIMGDTARTGVSLTTEIQAWRSLAWRPRQTSIRSPGISAGCSLCIIPETLQY